MDVMESLKIWWELNTPPDVYVGIWQETLSLSLARVWLQNTKFQKKFRHLHGDLNLDEIKNALRLLSVNGETNLMNLIRL